MCYNSGGIDGGMRNVAAGGGWLGALCGRDGGSRQLGVRETDSDLVTALRTGVVLAFSALVLRERLRRRELGGLVLLVAGTLAIAAA